MAAQGNYQSESSKSTQNSSRHLDLECAELFEEPNVSLIPTFRCKNSSASFIQEIHGEIDCEESAALEIEEYTAAAPVVWTHSETEYLKSLQERDSKQSSFLAEFLAQSDLEPKMRSTLYDWMMEVCAEFTLTRETYHLAISYVDQAFSVMKNIKKEQFQLLGLAAMVIAAKNEEVLAPHTRDWERAIENGFTSAQLRRMERELLNSLQ